MSDETKNYLLDLLRRMGVGAIGFIMAGVLYYDYKGLVQAQMDATRVIIDELRALKVEVHADRLARRAENLR